MYAWVQDVPIDQEIYREIMVGLGEERNEVLQLMDDLRSADVDFLTIGQYLRPSRKHAEVVRFYPPEEFRELKASALALGFAHVESGPLVRSSYHADEQIPSGRTGLLAG